MAAVPPYEQSYPTPVQSKRHLALMGIAFFFIAVAIALVTKMDGITFAVFLAIIFIGTVIVLDERRRSTHHLHAQSHIPYRVYRSCPHCGYSKHTLAYRCDKCGIEFCDACSKDTRKCPVDGTRGVETGFVEPLPLKKAISKSRARRRAKRSSKKR